MPQDRRMTEVTIQNTQILRTYDLESSDRISFQMKVRFLKLIVTHILIRETKKQKRKNSVSLSSRYILSYFGELFFFSISFMYNFASMLIHRLIIKLCIEFTPFILLQ